MNKLGLRNVILVSLSAALLNLSFVLAQPAQPPANGALTPNFTGLNVNSTTTTGTLKADSIREKTQNNGVSLDDNTFVNGTLTIYDEELQVNSINTVENAPLLSVLKPLEVSQLETDTIISKDDSGEPVRIDDDLYVQDRLQVNSDSFLRNTNVNGTLSVDRIEARGTLTTFPENIQVNGNASANYLRVRGESGTSLRADSDVVMHGDLEVDGDSLLSNTNINGILSVNTIEEKTSGNGTRFDNYIVVSGAVNAQSFGGASADFGSLNISGTNFLTYLKNRISVVVPDYTESNDTYATCPRGTIAISCGATGRYWSSRLHSVYRSSERSCRALWGAGSQNRTTAVCFDY